MSSASIFVKKGTSCTLACEMDVMASRHSFGSVLSRIPIFFRTDGPNNDGSQLSRFNRPIEQVIHKFIYTWLHQLS